MTDRPPLTAFDDDVVETVAAETGMAPGRLREALRRHQEHARSLPGVDDLVYEWRRFLPYDPLVRREPETYVLALERSVWVEFGEQLSFDDATLDAVVAVHARQARRALSADARGPGAEATAGTGTSGTPGDAFDGAEAMVLTR